MHPKAYGSGATRYLTVPNLFSLARLPLAAAFLLLPQTVARVIIIIAAGATDFLDGWWARTRGPRTSVGEVLDPVTDKIFVVTALTAFAVWGTIEPAALLVLLARDLYVSAGALILLLLRRQFRLKARFPGKVTTTLQITAVLVLTLVPQAARPMVLLVGAASGWAIIDYTLATVRDSRALRTPARQR
jgi:CDP-diacylglycerol--glycerol-3-phosphate 3-phosphatidyltransferase